MCTEIFLFNIFQFIPPILLRVASHRAALYIRYLSYFLPARRIALAGNSHRIVSVWLSGCLSQPVLYENENS